MNLPGYFLADLPPGAELSPTTITEACLTLQRNRRQYLAACSTFDLIETVADVAANWLNPLDSFRCLALEKGPAATGFSLPTFRRGLDAFFQRITADTLRTLVLQDLGHLERMDRFVSSDPEHHGRRLALASGPQLLAHVAAGNLPPPTLMSIVLGLLTRSAQFVKCASGTSLLPRLFAHSLYAAKPKIASCLEIAEWPRHSTLLDNALFAQADCVTVTGNDETIATLKSGMPPGVRFLGYGHRVSFGYVAREVLSRSEARQIAVAAARDVSAWDQAGCLSPHLYYVETGGTVTPLDFSELLAAELDKLEEIEPRAPIPTESAAHIASRRAAYELRATASMDTRLWQSQQSTAWTVVFENNPSFQISCLNRFVYVKAVGNLDETLTAAATVEGKVSSVALAAVGDKALELALKLARWGVSRICPPGQLQDPPLTWRHDGRPPLADLVAWTDYEKHER